MRSKSLILEDVKMIERMKSNAVVLTGGLLNTNSAKTAHGLIRGSDRFKIVGIIDDVSSGKDAGDVLDGKSREIPIYPSIEVFRNAFHEAAYCVVGVATKGGVIPESLREQLKTALQHNLSIVNGLHEYVSDISELSTLAKERGLEIIDVRKPRKATELHFWSGAIQEVSCPKIAILGTDCALGKRTTTRFLTQAMNGKGYKAEMIYTGQTGWMQGAKYGFIFDSTLNDFVSGEMEHAIVTCYRETNPDIIFIEGQSSLHNPSGPAGAEWIVSANAEGVILQHDPVRKHYKDMEYYPAFIPPIQDVVKMIEMYGSKTLAITLNTAKTSAEEARSYAETLQLELGLPVILPLEDGMERIIQTLIPLINR